MSLPRRLLLALLGLTAGTGSALAIAEGVFHARDDGAFPHVNFYVPDPVLAVRLQPGATERIQFSGNPLTSVRVNKQGYRGEDWPSPFPDDSVLVLGDSQVFGLGVEEAQTASAVLATELKRPVFNAGVPTYGPLEYLALAKELLQSHKPRTVVVVINMSNDFFETGRPNTDRHALWDGWAVRKETAPASVTEFPGRGWLMNESHAMFALRQWMAAPSPAHEAGFPSEGTALDLLPREAARPPDPPSMPEGEIATKIAASARNRILVEQTLAWRVANLFPELAEEVELQVPAARNHHHPGDIVYEEQTEEARSIVVTAEMLSAGAKLRKEMPERLAKWAAANPKDPAATQITKELAEQAKAEKVLAELGTQIETAIVPESPLGGIVQALKLACKEHGAELVIVVLPVDVQVSPLEWEKYGKDPADPTLDLSATRALLTDLVTATEAMGARAVDTTDALLAAEPGAFLDADIHMSAKGQAAFAGAIASRITSPAPTPRPAPGLPSGRSRVPTADELTLADEITVRGSTRNHCSTRQVREWLYVDCEVPYDVTPWVQVEQGGLETWTGFGGGYARLLTPLIAGRNVRASFVWPKSHRTDETRDVPWQTGRSAQLEVTWAEETPQFAFLDVEAPARRPDKKSDCPSYRRMGDPTRGCEAFRDPNERAPYKACERVLACATGTRNPLPVCPSGQVNAGAAGHCFDVCEETPCTEGTCQDWMGVQACL